MLVVPEQATLSLGEDVYIGRYVELGPGGLINIGDFTSIQDRSIFVGDVQIGRYCLFSLNVLMTSGTHYYDEKPAWLIRDQDAYVRSHRGRLSESVNPVRVEDDCWIGANVVVVGGVTIGKGCVVGANSVVNRDLPPYSVVAGAPARIVKKRLEFDPPRRLNALAEKDLPYFYSGFGISASDREIGRAQGGLLASSESAVALNLKDAKEIAINARSLGAPCSLNAVGTQREIPGKFTTVKFPVQPGTGGLFRISVVGSEQSRWPICVSEVSVA